MEKKFNSHKNCWEFYPQGDIDIINCDQFKQEILQAYRDRPTNLYIEGSAITYLDSTALGALITVYKTIHEAGHSLTVANLKHSLHKLFTITRLDEVIQLEGESE